MLLPINEITNNGHIIYTGGLVPGMTILKNRQDWYEFPKNLIRRAAKNARCSNAERSAFKQTITLGRMVPLG